MIQAYKNYLNNQLLPLLVALCAFSIPLKTGVFSVFVGLLIITWAISGNYRGKFQRIADNRVAVAAILLFLIFTIGLLYGDVAWQDRLPGYMKYHKLLYIPIVISVIRTDRHRRWAMNAFLIACLVVMLLSYMELFSVIPFHDDGQGFIVTKNRITHNILMAFAAFMMMHRAYAARASYRYVWICLALMATFNILVMVNGVTGQLILATLVILFLIQVRSIKPIKFILAGLISIGLVVYFFGVHPNNRMASQFSSVNDPSTSSGQRLDFYKHTFELVRQSPLYGNGAGSFKFEYQKLVHREGDVAPATNNPHNQYLLTASEIGLIGLAAFVYLLLTNIQKADELRYTQHCFTLQGLVLVMAFGSLFNSLLMDAGEGRFYTVMVAVIASAVGVSRKSGAGL
jgi:O-antigen ligase